MKKLALIYNPQSGDGRIAQSLSNIVDFFTKQDFEVTIHPSQAPREAAKWIEDNAARFERLVVCGGDGMMHEALNGYMHAGCAPVLGYIPTGTVNDFANSHQIPMDMMKAAEVAAGDASSILDTGCFNGEYFSYVAAFGAGTSVSYQTPQEQKRILGSMAYLINALAVVDFAHWENNCSTMKITWQGGEIEGDFLLGMVMNSRFVAGSDKFTSDIFNWHDGLLEGLFIRRPMNLVELNTIIGSLIRSDFNHPLIERVQSPWFEFEGDPTAWTLDGEFGGEHEMVTARAKKEALRMALPADYIESEKESEAL